jgi:glutamate-1-semialdehyde aminotransferase
MIGVHFTRENPKNARTTQQEGGVEVAKKFFRHALESGIIYLTPETPHLFISAAHTREDLDNLISVAEDFARRNATP